MKRVIVRAGPGGPPRQPPIGIVVARTAKAMERAFDDALAAAGGTRPTWLALLAIKSGAARTQGTIAERVGIRGPTLTHHLDRLERDGLVVRTRAPENRRVQRVELTAAGNVAFGQLRDAAGAFDRRARTGISAEEAEVLRALLDRLHANVDSATAPPRRTGDEPVGPPTPKQHRRT